MKEHVRSRHESQSVQQYAREARVHLDPAVFRPVARRLWWLPAHGAVILACATAVLAGAPWYVALACAIVAGHSWGCLGFLAHETLHHAVTKNRAVERLVGLCGFAPYCLSPTLWTACHNQAHHGNTGRPVADPDGFGTLGFWQSSPIGRALETFTPGSARKRSAPFLPLWFSVHSFLVLVFHSRRNDYYTRISRRVVYTESAALVTFWIAVPAGIGPWSFLFVYVLPLLIANAVIMSYI